MSPTTPHRRPISDWRIPTHAPAQSFSAQSIASPGCVKLYSLKFSVELSLRHEEHFAGGGLFLLLLFFWASKRKVRAAGLIKMITLFPIT